MTFTPVGRTLKRLSIIPNRKRYSYITPADFGDMSAGDILLTIHPSDVHPDILTKSTDAEIAPDRLAAIQKLLEIKKGAKEYRDTPRKKNNFIIEQKLRALNELGFSTQLPESMDFDKLLEVAKENISPKKSPSVASLLDKRLSSRTRTHSRRGGRSRRTQKRRGNVI
jgi:hypothetical protein